MSQRAGWYDDPENPQDLRYFDGVVWTTHTTPRQGPATSAPAPAAASAQPAAAPTQQLPYGQPPNTSPQQQYGQQQQNGGQPQYGRQPSYPPAHQQYTSMPPGYGASLGLKTTPDGQPLASYGQRVGAYLLDLVIAGLASLVLGGYWIWQFVQWYVAYLTDIFAQTDAGGTPALDQAEITSQATSHLLPFVLVSLVVQILYQVVFLTRWGATPGKMALGIAVRLSERPGNITVLTALRRIAIPVVASLLGFLPVLGLVGSLGSILDLLWPAWDERRQALHDKLAATNVVIKPKRR